MQCLSVSQSVSQSVCLFLADLGDVLPGHLDKEDEEDGKEDVAKGETDRANFHLESQNSHKR